MSGLVLDTSAVVAMLTGEPEGERLRSAFVAGRPRWIGAVGACCAYAAAKALSLPLLHKGEDFQRTDIAVVEW